MKILRIFIIIIYIFTLSACSQKEAVTNNANVKIDEITNSSIPSIVNNTADTGEDGNDASCNIPVKEDELSEYDIYMSKAVQLKNVVVSSSLIDYDKDNNQEEVQIVLDEGYFHEDDELWSGRGPKWVGAFSIRVYKEKKEVFNASLNKLINPNSEDNIFFYAPEFQLYFDDYNFDRNMDFVLSQYFSTNGCECYPFTISDTGIIRRLEIDGKYAFFISPMNRENSVLLPISENKVEISYYDNTQASYVVDHYIWNAEKNKFLLDMSRKRF